MGIRRDESHGWAGSSRDTSTLNQEPVRNVTGAVPAFSALKRILLSLSGSFGMLWNACDLPTKDTLWCFIGSSWNVRVWLQSLSREPEMLSVSQ